MVADSETQAGDSPSRQIQGHLKVKMTIMVYKSEKNLEYIFGIAEFKVAFIFTIQRHLMVVSTSFEVQIEKYVIKKSEKIYTYVFGLAEFKVAVIFTIEGHHQDVYLSEFKRPRTKYKGDFGRKLRNTLSE